MTESVVKCGWTETVNCSQMPVESEKCPKCKDGIIYKEVATEDGFKMRHVDCPACYGTGRKPCEPPKPAKAEKCNYRWLRDW